MTPVPDRGVKVALDQRPELAQVIARVPGWAERDIAEVSEMAGLTNRNYLVTVGVERYVVRVSRDNARYLGIDREGELAALRKAEACGIGAEARPVADGALLLAVAAHRQLRGDRQGTRRGVPR